jgi:hypothetical protein
MKKTLLSLPLLLTVIFSFSFGMLLPLSNVFAQSDLGGTTIKVHEEVFSGTCKNANFNLIGLANFANCVVKNILLPLLVTGMITWFMWGVYKNFFENVEKVSQTRGAFVLSSVIGFVLILSIFAIVFIVMGTFGLTAGGNVTATQLDNPLD